MKGDRGRGGGREDKGGVGVEIERPDPSRCVAQNLQMFSYIFPRNPQPCSEGQNRMFFVALKFLPEDARFFLLISTTNYQDQMEAYLGPHMWQILSGALPDPLVSE
eukprot:scaffold21242_cov37-Tisochrysis_lutea.AAC.3